jgi:uncharacterized membrane protein
MKAKMTRQHVEGVDGGGGVQIRKSLTLQRSPQDVYGFWRDFTNLATFMINVESVQLLGDSHSRWRIKGPAGKHVEYEALIIEDRPNELISWRSAGDSDVENAGSVHFKSSGRDRGTVITVMITYNPPAGRAGEWFSMLFGKEPSQQLSQDLRRFKALMETGEIPTAAIRQSDVLAMKTEKVS